MTPHILVLSPTETVHHALAGIFPDFKTHAFRQIDGISDLQGLMYCEFLFLDVCFLDSHQGEEGRLLDSLQDMFPGVQIIVMTTVAKVSLAIEAVRSGAANYLTLPLSEEEVRYVCESLQEGARFDGELDHLRDCFWRPEYLDVLKTQNPKMKIVFNAVRKVAPTRATVLFLGETGTGKNLLAKLLHYHGNRSDRAFIHVNCSAIPEGLLESELFGHERGAFTGASRRKLGRFEIANGGTIFLDEIGSMPMSMQGKLLRVLQDGSFERVGGEQEVKVDVRVLAATNDDLDAAIQQGSFRKDLFFRLNVFPIEIPPLRERLDDLEIITDSILSRLEQEYGKRIFKIAPEVMEAFRSYPWPGNVREVESLLERAYILESGRQLGPPSFPSDLFLYSALSAQGEPDHPKTLADVRRQALEQVEKNYLEKLMRISEGRTTEAAAVAGVTPRQLRNLLHRYHIQAASRSPQEK